MSIPLLLTLAEYSTLLDAAAKNPAIVVPSELDFVPGPGDDLESMIWVIIYTIMLHHHDSLRGLDKADYKCGVVDQFYGSLSYSGLAEKRTAMVFYISNPRFRGLGEDGEGDGRQHQC